ncbi:unnamed protein product, partial [Sphacelaria rigidula]
GDGGDEPPSSLFRGVMDAGSCAQGNGDGGQDGAPLRSNQQQQVPPPNVPTTIPLQPKRQQSEHRLPSNSSPATAPTTTSVRPSPTDTRAAKQQ